MGSGTWTFAGYWSNNSTSTIWVEGTGVVIFDSPSSRTLTFANLAGDEFHDVTFQSAAGSGTIVFSMAANGVRWSRLLLIQDCAGSTTTLATSNLSLTGGSLAVGNSGILTANAASVAVVDVTLTGGASGTLTLTSGSWTVSGQWDTSGAGSTFARGTSTVRMSGTSASVATLDATNGFNNLVVCGTITQNTALEVRGTLSVTGRLTTSGNNITGGANLAISGGGSLIGTASSIVVSGVTMNDAGTNSISLTTGSISASGSWDTSGSSSAFTAGSSTVTLTAATGTIALGPAQVLASLIIAGNEFSTIEFDGGSSTTTFTMASDGLVAQALRIEGGPGTPALTTSGASLPITANALTVDVGGSLTANASILTVRSLSTAGGAFAAGNSTVVVNISGGSINVPQTLHDVVVSPGISTTFASSITWSGALTLTSSTTIFDGNLTSSGLAVLNLGTTTVSIAGSWDTSSAATLTSIGSTVTFTGGSSLITLRVVDRWKCRGHPVHRDERRLVVRNRNRQQFRSGRLHDARLRPRHPSDGAQPDSAAVVAVLLHACDLPHWNLVGCCNVRATTALEAREGLPRGRQRENAQGIHPGPGLPGHVRPGGPGRHLGRGRQADQDHEVPRPDGPRGRTGGRGAPPPDRHTGARWGLLGGPKSPRSPRRSRLERKRSARSSEPFGTETRPSRREKPVFRKSGNASRPIRRRCRRDSTRPDGVRKPSAAIRRTSRMPAKSSKRSSESCSSSSVPSIAGSAPSRRRRPRWTAYRRTSLRERLVSCPRRHASQSSQMWRTGRKPR